MEGGAHSVADAIYSRQTRLHFCFGVDCPVDVLATELIAKFDMPQCVGFIVIRNSGLDGETACLSLRMLGMVEFPFFLNENAIAAS